MKLNKGMFYITKDNGKYKITFNNKKILKNIFEYLYSEKIQEKSFYVTNYDGSNTYFGKEHWQRHGVDFEVGYGENTFIFYKDKINFVINDKIDHVNIYVCSGNKPSLDNSSELIQIKPDKSITITTGNFDIIIKCVLIHIEKLFHFEFSERYNREKFHDFLKNFIPSSVTDYSQIFIKSLKIKNGLNFKISFKNQNNKSKLFKIGLKHDVWYNEEITDDNKKIEVYKKLEKINFFYVLIFFSIVIVGILMIATKLRFNIAIFVILFLLFISGLNFIYKKIKVIFGFKVGVKSK